MAENPRDDGRLDFRAAGDGSLVIHLSGDWRLSDPLPASDTLEAYIPDAVRTLRFDSREITLWDTSLPVFVARLTRYARERGMAVDTAGLPQGAVKLLELANAVPARDEAETRRGGRAADEEAHLFRRVGLVTLQLARELPEGLRFIGETLLSFARLLRGKAQFRYRDLFLIIQQDGPHALPIVSLVSFLVGLILAYMGAVQLQRVGVQIYIADLVSIAMVREVGALMTAIIMAGRTGASYAAELGTMQVNEEIDAYRTLGVSIMDFLVLPRVLALVLMIPLLTLYAGLVGTLAGMSVAITVFDIGAFEYYQQTLRALELKQFGVGVFKGTVYGVVIALSGCLRGIQCGRSAMAVGEATTSAVVTSIVFIVVTASAMTVMFYKLGI